MVGKGEACVPQRTVVVLLREVQSLQLSHFYFVFLLEFLGCFILEVEEGKVKQGTDHKKQ